MKISIRVLSVLLLLGCFTFIMNIGSFGETDNSYYKELLEQKQEYIQNHYTNEEYYEYYFYHPLFSPSLVVLLYTDIGEELTFEKEPDEADGDTMGMQHNWFKYGSGCLRSPELTQATKACSTFPYAVRESVSGLRECIQYFDITKEELLAGFKLMKENPDAIRPLLTVLTDEEYEREKGEDGTFGETDWPEFVIEALFMEDDAMAHRLLTKPFAVYVPELGRVVETNELNYELYYNSTAPDHYVTFDRLKSYDLTSDAIGEFIEYQMQRLQNHDTPYARELAELAAAREAQLKAAQTGDGAVNALWVVALAMPALAVVVLARKKRRI